VAASHVRVGYALDEGAFWPRDTFRHRAGSRGAIPPPTATTPVTGEAVPEYICNSVRHRGPDFFRQSVSVRAVEHSLAALSSLTQFVGPGAVGPAYTA